jgi:hypothetical protein
MHSVHMSLVVVSLYIVINYMYCNAINVLLLCSHLGGVSADDLGVVGPLLDDGSFMGSCIAKVMKALMSEWLSGIV